MGTWCRSAAFIAAWATISFLPSAWGDTTQGRTAAGSSGEPTSDIGFQTDHAFSEHYQATYYSLSDDSLIGTHDHLLLNLHQLSRIYTGGSQISDRGGSIGYVYAETSPYYVENSVTVNPNAVFMPRVSLAITPHVVKSLWKRDWDMSLGVIANRYAVLDALTLNPRLLCDSDFFYAGVGLFITRTYDDLLATDLSMGLHLSDKQKASASFSFGRTIEDQGIEDDFHAFSFLYQFRIRHGAYLGPAVQLYRGDLRSEDNYSIRLDVKI